MLTMNFSPEFLCCFFLVGIAATSIEATLKLRTSQDELNKVPDFPVKDLDELREFIKSNKDLPKISDLRLIQFHFARLHNLTATKEIIQTYYECFKTYTDLFYERRRDEPGVKAIRKLVAQYASPVRTKEDGQIILTKLIDSNSTDFTCESGFKWFLMAVEGTTHLYGVANHTEIIVDYRNVSVWHTFKVTGWISQKVLKVYEKALPIRTKAIHVVNVNPLISSVLTLAQPYISKELYDKIKVYREDQIEEFKSNVPKECLPEEYGGTLGPLSTLSEQFQESIGIVEPFFEEEENLVADTPPIQQTWTNYLGGWL